jgi:exosortase A-associated hydrolase 2
MIGAAPVRQSGSFVDGSSGQRFRLVHEPSGCDPLGTVLFVHAFAEEMNKSRRMAARMARLLAGDGWRVVQRDLCGCGDSSGEFADATWADWVRDVDDELAQALPQRPVWLWCHRAGALLARTALQTRPDAALLLWQPVLSGELHLQQFLRLHAGARITGSAKAHNDPPPLQQLRAGIAVEVGGYRLHPSLAIGLAGTQFDVPDGHNGRIVWLEVSIDETPGLSPHSERVLSRLRQRGLDVETEVVNGPMFWQTVEIEDCDALLARTRARLAMPAPSVMTASHQSAQTDACSTDSAR